MTVRERALDMPRGNTKQRQASPPKRPLFLALRSSKWFILFAVCLGLFTDSFFYTSVVILVPFSIHRQAGIPDEKIQMWTGVLMACFSIPLTFGSPIAGYRADKFDIRRSPIMFGQVLLIAGTILMWQGRHIAVLVLGRICHGAASAIFWAVGQALLADTVGIESIGNALGFADISASMGYLIAPLLTGALLDHTGVDAVYAAAIAFVSMATFLSLAFIEKKVASQWEGGVQMPPIVAPSTEKLSTFPEDRVVSMISTIQKGVTVNPVEPQSDSKPRGSLLYIRVLLKSPRMLTALFGCFVAGNIL
jgi:MFS family permease